MLAPTEAWDPSLVDMEPYGFMEASFALLWAYGIDLAAPLVAILLLFLLSYRLTRQAGAASRVEQGADAQPATGAKVVRGRVEIESGPAVRVSVTQTGRDSKHKNSWTTTWTEVGRTVEARPFALVTASGDRVRVEPSDAVRLVDDLDRVERTGLMSRVKRAELTDGEAAVILGEIAATLAPGRGVGYRDVGQELVMRSGASGMLISTKGLEAPLRAAAALRRRWGIALAVVMVLGQVAGVRYHVARAAGHVEPAVVVARSQRTVKTKKGVRQEYTVTYRVESTGREVEQGAEGEDYPKLTQGRVIPVWVSPTLTTLGGRPTEHGLVFLLPMLAMAGVLVAAIVSMRNARPWYERKTLVDTRRGRLQDDCPPELRPK